MSDCPIWGDVKVGSTRFFQWCFLYPLVGIICGVIDTWWISGSPTNFPTAFSIHRWPLSESVITCVVAEWWFFPFCSYLDFVKKTSSLLPFIFEYHYGLMDFFLNTYNVIILHHYLFYLNCPDLYNGSSCQAGCYVHLTRFCLSFENFLVFWYSKMF